MCFSDVAEFVCTQNSGVVSWTISSSTGGFTQLSFHYFFDSTGPMKSTMINSTIVRGFLIYGNSSFLESSLTIAASLSVTLRCNSNAFVYQPNSEGLYN